MDLKLLREATRPEHEATENALPLLGKDLTRAGYVHTLQQFHGVIGAWDTVAAESSPATDRQMVSERRRSEAILRDLSFFNAEGDAIEPPRAAVERVRQVVGPTDSDAHRPRFLGAMYVVEGSTLGGQYIAHHVEATLGLREGEGDSFFRGYGKETMPKWREFQQVLQGIPDEESDAVIAAAKRMFGVFQWWLAPDRAQSPPEFP